MNREIRPLPDDSFEGQGWELCPEGRFSRLSHNLRQVRDRRQFLKASGAVAAALIAAGGGLAIWATSQGRSGSSNGRRGIPLAMTCGQATQVAYRLKRKEVVPPETMARFQDHLASCSKCSDLAEKMGVSG